MPSPEKFFIFCIRVHFQFPHMKMKRKRYLPVLFFRDISLQNHQILRPKCIDVNVKRLLLAHVLGI